MNKGSTALRGVALAVCSVDCFAALAMTDKVLAMTGASFAVSHLVSARSGATWDSVDCFAALAMTDRVLAMAVESSLRGCKPWQSTGSSCGCGRSP